MTEHESLTEDEIEDVVWTLENSEDEIDQKAIALISLFKQRSDVGWQIAMEAVARLRVLRSAVDHVLDSPDTPELWEDEIKRAVAALDAPTDYQRQN